MGLYHSLREWFNPIYMEDNDNNCSNPKFPDEVLIPTLKEIVNQYQVCMTIVNYKDTEEGREKGGKEGGRDRERGRGREVGEREREREGEMEEEGEGRKEGESDQMKEEKIQEK